MPRERFDGHSEELFSASLRWKRSVLNGSLVLTSIRPNPDEAKRAAFALAEKMGWTPPCTWQWWRAKDSLECEVKRVIWFDNPPTCGDEIYYLTLLAGHILRVEAAPNEPS